MKYYQEQINCINKMLNNNDFKNALSLINQELNQAYVPKDVEKILLDLTSKIPTEDSTALSDEMLQKYLFSSEIHQSKAIFDLKNKNLREYLDLCERYFVSNADAELKTELIIALIQQEINCEIRLIKNNMEFIFNPYYLQEPLKQSSYLLVIKKLSDYYYKEPSKYEMAKSLLQNYYYLNIPLMIDEDEVEEITSHIILKVDELFE